MGIFCVEAWRALRWSLGQYGEEKCVEVIEGLKVLLI